MPACFARSATECASSGCAAIQRCTSCSTERPAGRASPLRLNCSCPPGRLKNITSCDATRRAMSRPRSSSTSASARSRPAVTPAPVRSLPSRTYSASASTVIVGCASASASATAQCVVRWRPFSRPVSASTNAPVQIEPYRRLCTAAERSHASTSVRSAMRPAPGAPATSSVSMRAGTSGATQSGNSCAPEELRIGPDSHAITRSV